MTLVLTYRVPAFADCSRSLCSLRAPWLDFTAETVGRDQRRFPLFWQMPRRDSVTIDLFFPKTFDVAATPQPVSSTGAGAALNVQSENVTDWHARLTLDYQRVDVDAEQTAYSALKACLETRAATGRQYWVWERRTR